MRFVYNIVGFPSILCLRGRKVKEKDLKYKKTV